MAQPAFSSVDDYLDAQPPAARRILRRVRTVLRQTLPAAEESISYKIPTYTLPGGPVIYFAGWKDHLSLYPVSEQLISQLAAAVAAPLKKGKLRIEKGTLRIPYAESLPVHLISHLAQLRAKQVADKQKRPAATAEKPAAKSAATPQPAPRAKGSTPRSAAAKPPVARAARTAGKAKPSAASASRSAAKAKPSAASASRTAAKAKPSAASVSRSAAKAKPSAASASRAAAKAKPSAASAASASRTAAKAKPSAASASRTAAKTKPSAAKRR